MFETVYCIGKERTTVNLSAIARIETLMNVQFPSGYREYMMELGEGYYCEHVRVHLPDEIFQSYKSKQELWSGEYWWTSDLWTPEIAASCIPIADSQDGDQLLFYPIDKHFYYLDRGRVEVYKVQGDLLRGITEFVTIKCGFLFNFPFFIPEKYSGFSSYTTDSDDVSFDEVVNEIAKMNIHSQNDIHEYNAYFYLPDFLGLISVYDPSGEIDVSIYAESDMNTHILEMIVTKLQDLGLSEWQ